MDNINEFEEFDDEDLVVVVVDDEGVEHEYIVVDAVTHKGSNYMLVTPGDYEDDEDDSEDFEACIIKEVEESGDDVIYVLVDDEVEFNEVAALFMENAEDYGIEV